MVDTIGGAVTYDDGGLVSYLAMENSFNVIASETIFSDFATVALGFCIVLLYVVTMLGNFLDKIENRVSLDLEPGSGLGVGEYLGYSHTVYIGRYRKYILQSIPVPYLVTDSQMRLFFVVSGIPLGDRVDVSVLGHRLRLQSHREHGISLQPSA